MDNLGASGSGPTDDAPATTPLTPRAGPTFGGGSADLAEVTPDVAARNAAAIAAATDSEVPFGDSTAGVVDISPELLDYAAHDRGASNQTDGRSGEDRRRDIERESSGGADGDSGDIAT